MSTYSQNGYINRIDYLDKISEEYGVPLEVVLDVADLLGPEEDFDGLISSLEDYEDYESVGDFS